MLNLANGHQIAIRPTDSLPSPEIEANVEENLGLIPNWLDFEQPKTATKDDVAWLIGSGPSLDDAMRTGFIYPEQFEANPSNSLWLAKHALPWFTRDWDLVPLNCVALDPRPITGTSTHDKNRLELYKSAPAHTVFYIASMTSPTVTHWLLDNGFKVIGWHAASDCLKKFTSETKRRLPQNKFEVVHTGIEAINGGTASILRTIGLVKETLGVSRFRLLGLDCSLRLNSIQEAQSRDPSSAFVTELDEITGAPRRLEISYGMGNKLMWTTGELAAALQDIDQLFRVQREMLLDVKVVGTDKGRSLVGQVFDRFQET